MTRRGLTDGEDNLMVGTDYGHADYSNDIEAIQTLAHGGKINPSLAQKILGDNPKRLYGCERRQAYGTA